MAKNQAQTNNVQRLIYEPNNANLSETQMRERALSIANHYGAQPVGHVEYDSLFVGALIALGMTNQGGALASAKTAKGAPKAQQAEK